MSQHLTYAGCNELAAVGDLFPNYFKYTTIVDYKVFDDNDNLTKRLRFTGILSNGHFEVPM